MYPCFSHSLHLFLFLSIIHTITNPRPPFKTTTTKNVSRRGGVALFPHREVGGELTKAEVAELTKAEVGELTTPGSSAWSRLHSTIANPLDFRPLASDSTVISYCKFGELEKAKTHFDRLISMKSVHFRGACNALLEEVMEYVSMNSRIEMEEIAKRIFRFLKCFSRRSNLLTAHLLKNSGKSGQYCLSLKAKILVVDSLEKGTEHEDEYMISEKELFVNRFISIPKDMGTFNYGAFVVGIVRGVLDGAGFLTMVTAHFVLAEGVQIVDICLGTRPHNGGLINLEELCKLLCQRRKSAREAVSEDDCLCAISKLKVLGSGYEVISVGKRKLVRSVPTELNKDHNEILELAQVGDPLEKAALKGIEWSYKSDKKAMPKN
ncbi:hypothetical protein LOK49_LG09G00859 [Camellia lanceoleosa]|uniref:Uncharacterized protein n=1 Tax=Camellia lanceoleosa TaxID=1840588 RepID=A0ACC0GJZ6_9ERIC|nr:hypothetical protein LOK49_LG09G00859 [Camellia lanceoleosa]